jgi:capsular exopolysaccharide synthesis family protein
MTNELETITFPVAGGARPLSSGGEQDIIDLQEESIPLSHYLWVIRRHSWKVAAFVVVSLILTYIISSRFQPIYESTAAVNIDRAAPIGVVGSESERGSAVAQDVDPYIATQMKIIQSDAVLRSVAARYDLLAREGQFKGLTPDRIAALKASPTVLKQLRVIRPPNTYLVQISYRSTDPKLSADVANAIAHSYLEHSYRIQISSAASAAGFMEKQLDELKAKMERSGAALAQFEKELNVINPEQKTNIISARLLQLNTEYTNAQADRVKKEAYFNAVKSGSIAAAQISGQGDDLNKLQEKINDAQQRFAQIQTTRGPNHPDYKRAESELKQLLVEYQTARANAIQRIEADFHQAVDRENLLKTAVASTKADFDQLNSRSFEYQRLKEEAEADKRLYEELVTKIREASINAGFENKNTAVVDNARPALKAVFPNTKLNLLLAAVLSSLLGIGGILLIDSLDTTVREPEEIRRLFHTDLIGTLPTIKDSKLLAPAGHLIPAAADIQKSYPDEYSQRSFNSFEEAVRMVRNSILLSDFNGELKSILFTSATPGEGKSTTALHLAIAHAEQGKKTLLVDADLRRPTLHKRLSVDSSTGLAGVLAGQCSWKEATCDVSGIANLSIIPAGPPSRRAADLIGAGISEILSEASRSFDLIIVDGPPLLGFAEPMQLAIAVDGVIVVAVAGETNRKAVGASITTLQRLRANVLGLVLNRTSKEHGAEYYYYYQHEKYYKVA